MRLKKLKQNRFVWCCWKALIIINWFWFHTFDIITSTSTLCNYSSIYLFLLFANTIKALYALLHNTCLLFCHWVMSLIGSFNSFSHFVYFIFTFSWNFKALDAVVDVLSNRHTLADHIWKFSCFRLV